LRITDPGTAHSLRGGGGEIGRAELGALDGSASRRVVDVLDDGPGRRWLTAGAR
jgi:hypothetical protein